MTMLGDLCLRTTVCMAFGVLVLHQEMTIQLIILYLAISALWMLATGRLSKHRGKSS